ncbi:hypothetical protein CC86DRAFT_119796 [Ophiobolus disseminans]|uniref:Uncharacterized protein n=1 Tax=Ophiobolus disseminans TaxID=1469910 RepID=A0A6A6ZH31_9PLEO|nr:hypothetical protein CC86DRAFT_119796 [Ophiobolus disseminans]
MNALIWTIAYPLDLTDDYVFPRYRPQHLVGNAWCGGIDKCPSLCIDVVFELANVGPTSASPSISTTTLIPAQPSHVRPTPSPSTSLAATFWTHGQPSILIPTTATPNVRRFGSMVWELSSRCLSPVALPKLPQPQAISALDRQCGCRKVWFRRCSGLLDF